MVDQFIFAPSKLIDIVKNPLRMVTSTEKNSAYELQQQTYFE